jgi:hypothetical protein
MNERRAAATRAIGADVVFLDEENMARTQVKLRENERTVYRTRPWCGEWSEWRDLSLDAGGADEEHNPFGALRTFTFVFAQDL